MRNFVVTIDGKSYQVGVEEVGSASLATVNAADKANVSVPSAAPSAAKGTEETKPQAPKAAAPVNGVKCESPFPGLIKGFLVADGALVKKDQPILVLEAMKMDNDITSPCDGKVTFSVTKGSNVESGTVLAVIG